VADNQQCLGAVESLPPKLRPKSGRYTVEAALRVWLAAYHWIGYDADPESPAYKRATEEARRELRPIIKHEPPNEGRRQADEHAAYLYRRLGISGAPPRSQPVQWIEHADLVKLANDYGVEFDANEKAEKQTTATPKKGGRPEKYSEELIDHANALYASGDYASLKAAAGQAVIDKNVKDAKLPSIVGKMRKPG
jgi:hypothetical protein